MRIFNGERRLLRACLGIETYRYYVRLRLPRILIRRANASKPFCREKVVSTPAFFRYKAARHATFIIRRMNRSNEAMYVSKYPQKWYLKMLESNPAYRYVRSVIAGWPPWQKSVADRL